MCKWLLVALGIFFSAYTPLHPFYASVTEIEHNAAQKAVEVSCRMFTDDLESTLNRLYKTKADLSAPADSSLVKKLLSDYVGKHLRIKADDQPAVMRLIGYERENGALWSYWQADGIATAGKVEVLNDLLYESFASQIGILHVTVHGKRKSHQLTNPEKRAIFVF